VPPAIRQASKEAGADSSVSHHRYSLQPLANELLDFTGSPLSGVLIGELGTMLSPVLEFNADITAIGDALGGGTPDLMTALQDLANMPADIINAFLNGYGDVDLMSLLQDVGISLPALSFFGTDANLTDVTVDLQPVLRRTSVTIGPLTPGGGRSS
jgi:hypothetical protein